MLPAKKISLHHARSTKLVCWSSKLSEHFWELSKNEDVVPLKAFVQATFWILWKLGDLRKLSKTLRCRHSFSLNLLFRSLAGFIYTNIWNPPIRCSTYSNANRVDWTAFTPLFSLVESMVVMAKKIDKHASQLLLHACLFTWVLLNWLLPSSFWGKQWCYLRC